MHVQISLASFVAVMGFALVSFSASAMPLAAGAIERAADEGNLTQAVQLNRRGGAARVGAARVRVAPRVGVRVGGARIGVRPVGRYPRSVGRRIVRAPFIIRPRVLLGPGIVYGPSVYEAYPYDSYYYEDAYPDNAIAYCMQRFKSYDLRSRTYLGYDGLRHPCP